MIAVLRSRSAVLVARSVLSAGVARPLLRLGAGLLLSAGCAQVQAQEAQDSDLVVLPFVQDGDQRRLKAPDAPARREVQWTLGLTGAGERSHRASVGGQATMEYVIASAPDRDGVDLGELGSFEFDRFCAEGESLVLPPAMLELDGLLVEVEGWVNPLRIEGRQVPELLLHDRIWRGGLMPKNWSNDVHVILSPGQALIELPSQRTPFRGRLRIRPLLDEEGWLTAVYTLEDARRVAAGTGVVSSRRTSIPPHPP